MDGKLPKHIEITLTCLLMDNTLSRWTINGNSNMTTIRLRFKADTEVQEEDKFQFQVSSLKPAFYKTFMGCTHRTR